jgi:phosphoesterase RecJ-like protein
MQYLRKIDKEHRVYSGTRISQNLMYLPHTEYIITDPEIWQKNKFDLILIIDSGDLKNTGVQEHIKNYQPEATIINIDHHASNNKFGHINLVETTASSTAEVLYKLFKHNELAIDREIATCLLTGIMYDTDNFTNSATSPYAMHAASELISLGADIGLIRNTLFKNKTLSGMKIWGIALSRLSKHEETGLAYTFVTQDDLISNAVKAEDIEGVANLLNIMSNEDARASIFLKELGENVWKVSMRTTRDDIDLSYYAKNLGGGGHKKAAGCTVTGTMASALDKILNIAKSQTQKTPTPEAAAL